MSAFNDGQCPKCGKRFGWTGKVSDRPPCPKCGHQLPKEELEAADKQMEDFEKFLIARKKAEGEHRP